jgi:hypothetical protein
VPSHDVLPGAVNRWHVRQKSEELFQAANLPKHFLL